MEIEKDCIIINSFNNDYVNRMFWPDPSAYAELSGEMTVTTFDLNGLIPAAVEPYNPTKKGNGFEAWFKENTF